MDLVSGTCSSSSPHFLVQSRNKWANPVWPLSVLAGLVLCVSPHLDITLDMVRALTLPAAYLLLWIKLQGAWELKGTDLSQCFPWTKHNWGQNQEPGIRGPFLILLLSWSHNIWNPHLSYKMKPSTFAVYEPYGDVWWICRLLWSSQMKSAINLNHLCEKTHSE